jgi:hypothetical protein
MSKLLYIGLDNTWPMTESVPFLVEEKDYSRSGSTITLKSSLSPRNYGSVELVQHYSIPFNISEEELRLKYPKLEWLSWPCSVGRYKSVGYCVDVVFSPILHEKWDEKEKREWTRGIHGYWTGWLYGLSTAVVADTAMEVIESLKQEQRTPENVVRHLVSLSNEANSEKGLLYGMWDPKRFSEGISPTVWRSTHQILAHRFRTNKVPVKFAQCWIFSEVLVSLFRYLGLASRTIFIENAKIDRDCDGGVDFMPSISKSDGETLSYRGSILDNPWENVIDGVDSLGSFDNFNIPLEDVIPEEKPLNTFKSDGCEEIDLNEYVSSGDGFWNFHVLAEVYLSKGWSCVDGCPIQVTSSKDAYSGKKVLGPCPISALKSGLSDGHDFDYFNTTINGAIRYWRTTTIRTQEKDLIVTYPYDIVFGAVSSAGNQQRQIKIYTRDPHCSEGKSVIKLRITDSYQPPPHELYGVHHLLHPLIFRWKQLPPKGILIMKTQGEIKDKHYVQICYLTRGGNIISVDRQIVDSWEAYKPPSTPRNAELISMVLANLITKKWWVQVI